MKSMKKLVLAGLVLLASAMVLVGCDTNAGGSAEIINSEIGQVLTFSADSEQTLTMKNQGEYTLHESLEYSVGGGEWKQLQADAAISFGGAAGDLRMRGKSSKGMAKGSAEYAKIVFGYDDVKVSCSGDIRTLVDYERPTTVDTSEARFSFLFGNCSVLTKAPALPAEKLADSCYEGMFSGCTSLTSAPALPAETLALFCYTYMFYGCTSLTSAPALDAETLVPYCYQCMFSGCTSLTSAPALDVETLALFCYTYMFYGCTSLTSAPALDAETLVPYCYEGMFSGCTSLTSVTMLATDISAVGCLDGWLNNVSETGIFNKAAKMDKTTLQTYIPADWIVQVYDPQ